MTISEMTTGTASRAMAQDSGEMKSARTVSEEFQASRTAHRARHLGGLARVTASEFGRPTPGMAEARARFGV